MQLAVHHLMGHGRRNIAMLTGKAEEGLNDKRIQGWYQAHKANRLPVGPIMQAHYTRQGGYQATIDLLNSDQHTDAIFADSDLEAIGALRAMHEQGIRVPEDIALISFDGTVDSQFTWPSLSVIQQNAQAIANCVFKAATDPQNTPDLQLIDSTLVPRESCGCM